MPRLLGINAFLFLAFSLGWHALWLISIYLNASYELAILFLPQGLRLALILLLPKRFWPTIVASELLIISWLFSENLQQDPAILLSPFISLLAGWAIQYFWRFYPLYWQRLMLLLAGIVLNSLGHTLLIPLTLLQPTQIILTSFTGGILLVPFIYLIYEYLKQQNLQTFLARDSFDPPLKTSLLIWGSIFFAISICIQLTLTPEMESLLLIFILLPNIVMAYRFGWQGGVLAAVLGSLLLTITRHASGTFHQLQELQLFLSTQALLGIGLGIAVSRQQQLVQSLRRYRLKLEQELQVKRHLAEQLVQMEEAIRKEIARELHDEIGQNITAIQIQAQLVHKMANSDFVSQGADEITRLSRRIHQTTRQLLQTLRPQVLDEMALPDALRHLIQDFHFAQQGICCKFDYRLSHLPTDEVTVFTLYRLAQELLNNINKHAKAHNINISLAEEQDMITLDVSDDGVGIPQQLQSGYGLKGIGERVRALGGNWRIYHRQGTRIIVNLPTKFDNSRL